MKNPFIELCGCMCLTLLAPQPAAAKTAGEVPPADTLRTVFFTDIHVTPGNAQDSLFRIAVAEANASDADPVIFGSDLTKTVLADKIKAYFKAEIAGAGAVRKTLHEAVNG